MARRTRQELRDEVLRTGVELLREEGVTIRLDNLTFTRVFERIEQDTGRRVVHSMVYERIWQSQQAYQWEVLGELIRTSEYGIEPVYAAVLDVLEHAERSTVEGRWAALMDIVRVAGAVSLEETINSPAWHITLSAIGSSLSTATLDDDEHVAPAVSNNLAQQLASYTSLYQLLMTALGLRMKPGCNLNDFANLAGALVEGLTLRVPYLDDPDEPASATQGDDWTIYSLGLRALVEAFVEIDPRATPPAELPVLELPTSPSRASGRLVTPL